ncbi:MAG: gliding motility-associated C-terminal domain-containing protein [Flavobacteriales bacterium]|jgi:hypothetical protein|nr:gliding motility-associated C-terminal domain-containing protein [Flavobacteriales bacterium]
MKNTFLFLFLFAGLSLYGQEPDAQQCKVSFERIADENCENNCGDFHIVTNCNTLPEFKIQVYNRWGNLVFDSYDPKAIWDTEEMEEGVYVFQLSFTNEYGVTSSYKGNVTVIK